MSSNQHITLDSTVVQSPEMLATDVHEGQIILSIENGKYYGVTAVGERIWQLSSEPITLRELCNRLMAEYDVEPEVCEADVLEFVAELTDNKIIIVQS